MGALGIATGAAGGGLAAYGALKSAQDQSDLEKEKAQISYMQADELAQREVANDAIRKDRAFTSELDFGSAFAGSGKEGTGIGSQLEIQRQSDLASMLADRDAAFQEEMFRTTGKMNEQLASDTMSSGWINAAGSLLGAGGKIASMKAGGLGSPSTPQSLPSPGVQ